MVRSQPLPPVSRLEDKDGERRCAPLRQSLANTLVSLTQSIIATHDSLQSWTDCNDIQRYHDIYEVSYQDYHDSTVSIPRERADSIASLKELRLEMQRLFVARQIVLCDLLALPAKGLRKSTHKWSKVSQEVQHLVHQYKASCQALSSLLLTEGKRSCGVDLDRRNIAAFADGANLSPSTPVTPSKQRVRAQLQRSDLLYQSIQTLNAKSHFFREETEAMLMSSEEDGDLSSTLHRQYESIGVDLRGLLADWDQGRNTMLSSMERIDRISSRSSSGGLRSPGSPACSLGGLTEVDGSPAEALKMLTGEEMTRSSIEVGSLDEEIFEAVAIPQKRMSLTREEKMAKMQEDRRRRATFQERADANTNMLRELETVIKHRPHGRTASRATNG